ncbi:hypothetical protein GGS20DRAFT_65535 [Poronia punctata]|nr:hypothetical protein GGS20DRAFT_65535 [Poronia punctata]
MCTIPRKRSQCNGPHGTLGHWSQKVCRYLVLIRHSDTAAHMGNISHCLIRGKRQPSPSETRYGGMPIRPRIMWTVVVWCVSCLKWGEASTCRHNLNTAGESYCCEIRRYVLSTQNGQGYTIHHIIPREKCFFFRGNSQLFDVPSPRQQSDSAQLFVGMGFTPLLGQEGDNAPPAGFRSLGCHDPNPNARAWEPRGISLCEVPQFKTPVIFLSHGPRQCASF